MALPWRKRQAMRSIAKAIQVSPASVHRSIVAGEIVRRRNSIKPRLTEANKAYRVLLMKWFYMTEADRTVYMAPRETPSHSTDQSKRFITKVVFMAAIMRPIYARDGSLVFGGKLGMWPFIERVPAQKTQNRPADTIVTNPFNVGLKKQRDMLIDNVIPAVRAKCSSMLQGTELIIQQDRARCYVNPNAPAM
ncbi:hypothetical protein L917_13487 [Phytophthora nicotianae]|uniref:Transposase Tc1-like domain-containing protein n=1 Tax=Phytophthora nicotianae TaxID=4792 RepID=W2KQD2_PHYNI|nr:hypothetical protein L917_13487 [Phytophthora nicotianae]